MNSVVCQLVIVALLFVSFEGAMDVVSDGVPHGTNASHQSEFGHTLNAHDGELSDTELDGEHCKHCCHGHTAGICVMASVQATKLSASRIQVVRSAHVNNFAQAPPTPPPNA